MSLHPSLEWALHAALLEGHFLPQRPERIEFFWEGFLEGVVRLNVGILVERVETDLQRLLTRHLRRMAPDDWWRLLPKQARERARRRAEWSRATLGARRVTKFPHISWLTMGDTLNSIASLPPPEWQECLRAEGRRRSQFALAARRLKAFRDYHVAHPRPRAATSAEIRSLCRSARGLAVALRPRDWNHACRVLREEELFEVPGEWIDQTLAEPATASRLSAQLGAFWKAHHGTGMRWESDA